MLLRASELRNCSTPGNRICERSSVSKPAYKAAPVQIINWTGVYVGAHAGWGWTKEDYTLAAFGPGASSIPIGSVNGLDRDNFLGGGQIGFNWQTGNWVFGVEGDWSWTNSSTSTAVAGTGGTTATSSPTPTGTPPRLVASVTRRNSWLVYAKGGAAWMNVDYSSSTTVTGFGSGNSNVNSVTRSGWTLGAGIEQSLPRIGRGSFSTTTIWTSALTVTVSRRPLPA